MPPHSASADPITYQLTLTQFFRQTIHGQFPFPVSVTDILGEERFIGTMVVDASLLNQSIPITALDVFSLNLDPFCCGGPQDFEFPLSVFSSG